MVREARGVGAVNRLSGGFGRPMSPRKTRSGGDRRSSSSIDANGMQGLGVDAHVKRVSLARVRAYSPTACPGHRPHDIRTTRRRLDAAISDPPRWFAGLRSRSQRRVVREALGLTQEAAAGVPAGVAFMVAPTGERLELLAVDFSPLPGTTRLRRYAPASRTQPGPSMTSTPPTRVRWRRVAARSGHPATRRSPD